MQRYLPIRVNYFLSSSKEYLIIALLAVFSLLFASQAHAQTWTAQTSGTSNGLNGVYFVDANTGWAVGGSGTILKTTDGGSTWTSQTSGSSATFFSVFFVDSNTGWAVGSSGTILTTTDGGSTWTAQTSGETVTLRGVSFPSSTTGWTVGNSGVIRKTTNSGSTWTSQSSGTSSALQGVFFVNTTTGWAVGNNGTIIKTANGTSWSAQTSGVDDTLNSAYFADSSTGWSVGNSGVIVATANGGTTWTAQTSGTSNGLTGVYFVNSTTGWAVGSSVIITTTDGGTTWTDQTQGTTAALNEVYFVNSTTGWAVGNSGAILKFSGASASAATNPRAPFAYEEQRRQLALNSAPNAPTHFRLASFSCTPHSCPLELRFSYAPSDLHRGRATGFIFYDDIGRKLATISPLPAIAQNEYAMTFRPNGANSFISGKLCAVVDVLERCIAVSGWTDIVVDADAFAFTETVLDVERNTYRLMLRSAVLPTNADAGKTGFTATLMADTTGKQFTITRSYKFSAANQLLADELPAGIYIVKITPWNGEGREGKIVERRISVPTESVSVREERAASSATDELLRAIYAQLQEILRLLLQLLK